MKNYKLFGDFIFFRRKIKEKGREKMNRRRDNDLKKRLSTKEVIRERKKLKKHAQKRNSGNLCWVGGILYSIRFNEVKELGPCLPKPNKRIRPELEPVIRQPFEVKPQTPSRRDASVTFKGFWER